MYVVYYWGCVLPATCCEAFGFTEAISVLLFMIPQAASGALRSFLFVFGAQGSVLNALISQYVYRHLVAPTAANWDGKYGMEWNGLGLLPREAELMTAGNLGGL